MIWTDSRGRRWAVHDYTIVRGWPQLRWEAGHLSATVRVFAHPYLFQRCASVALGDQDRTPTDAALERQLASCISRIA